MTLSYFFEDYRISCVAAVHRASSGNPCCRRPEYLLDADWRKEKLLEIRNLIKKHGPELEEGIKYGALAYAHKNGGGFALNAQKNVCVCHRAPAANRYAGRYSAAKSPRVMRDTVTAQPFEDSPRESLYSQSPHRD